MATALRVGPYRTSVVGLAVSSDEVLSGLRATPSDIALISAALKDGPTAGLKVIREIRAAHTKTDVIVLLDVIERAMVSEVFQAGAVGILCRDESFDVLCKCIHAVHEGQVWANSEALRIALDALSQLPRPLALNIKNDKAGNLLTKREEDLVQLVAEGLTNRDISRQLNLSEHTVRNYLFRIFNKLGTSNRLELAVYALNRREEDQDSSRAEESEN
jgi:DNA-binding NarL/FixJ family response regulator